MARIVTFLLMLVGLPTAAMAQEASVCGAPKPINDGWTTATPDAVGLDAGKLCDLDKLLDQWPDRNIHAVIVARHSRLVMERYFDGVDESWGQPLGIVRFGPDVKHDVKSVSKSATSLLVGIALAERKFPALDSPVFDAFPEYADLRTPDKERITFRHLLTMSAGLAWDEDRPYTDPLNDERRMLESSDPFRFVLSQPVIHPSGTIYHYSNGVTSLLGEALVRATGRGLQDYAREKLFAPLDIIDFDWPEVGASRKLGAYGSLRLRPRDMAKLGQLMLTDGQWNGRRVLPTGWAAESAKPRIKGDGLFFYGYQWWLGRSFLNGRELDWIAGFGVGAQRVYVIPAFDLVFAITTGHYDGPLGYAIASAILNRVVLPAVKD
ncbi:serine hydrolase [Reyranella sp.]|jgi:CubicO group peptidase (beta-lactamase class C family)|uniref:serine hydrolase domain-containing protein n=1 Tax=Reyranella sp. TaxID=1929291 RepID=UPI002F92840C